MELLPFLILFLGIGFGVFKLERGWQKRQHARQILTTEQPGQAIAPPPLEQRRRAAWLQLSLPKLQREPPEQAMALRFRAWVETGLGQDPKLQAWLLGLSLEQTQVLVKHLAAYCEQLKVNLNWLLEQQLDIAPTLKNSTQEIVVNYCSGIWKAAQIKPNLDLFSAYQQLTQATTAEQKTIQRELLARLAQQELVTVQPLAATLTGTEDERQAKIVQALHQAAAKDWERFATVFKTLMSSNGAHPKNGLKQKESA